MKGASFVSKPKSKRLLVDEYPPPAMILSKPPKGVNCSVRNEVAIEPAAEPATVLDEAVVCGVLASATLFGDAAVSNKPTLNRFKLSGVRPVAVLAMALMPMTGTFIMLMLLMALLDAARVAKEMGGVGDPLPAVKLALEKVDPRRMLAMPAAGELAAAVRPVAPMATGGTRP